MQIVKVPAATGEALTVERARDMLAAARDLDEIRTMAAQADAIALYLRQERAAIELQTDAAEISIWSRRRLGELTAELGKAKAGPGRGKRSPVAESKASALESLGLDRRDVARCELLAAADESTIKAHIAAVRDRAARLTVSSTIAAVSHREGYDSDVWNTPREIVELIRRLLGGIDLDPASNAVAQRTVRAKRFYTAADDGLAHRWKGRVFCNPPYSQPVCSRFVAAFIAAFESGDMPKGVILLNSSTDTAWWHDLARRFPVCVTRGRLSFEGPDGQPAEGNRVGQAIFAAGCGRDFDTLFASVGLVLRAA